MVQQAFVLSTEKTRCLRVNASKRLAYEAAASSWSPIRRSAKSRRAAGMPPSSRAMD